MTNITPIFFYPAESESADDRLPLVRDPTLERAA